MPKTTYLEMDMDFYHVYQPIINLKENNVCGYEVLLRSNDFHNPEIFFEYAKEHNKLFDLDMRSINEAMKTDLSLFGEGLLFINIFPSTFIHPEFLLRMRKINDDLKIRPNSIVFEISEAEKKIDIELIRDVNVELRNLGYLIALDDIGKGYSTLQSIVELEPDIIKLDRFFAKNIVNSTKKQELLHKINNVFGGEFMVVLEGLETKEDLEIAKGLEIPFAQGFYLGKPMPMGFYSKKDI